MFKVNYDRLNVRQKDRNKDRNKGGQALSEKACKYAKFFRKIFKDKSAFWAAKGRGYINTKGFGILILC
jgi:hypothetical protein